MITRLFRVQINPVLREEFEARFVEISIPTVQAQAGLLSVEILKPTQWSPYEYGMISRWRDEVAVRAFAGENWNQAVIPEGMAQFVQQCWVHHYQDWERHP